MSIGASLRHLGEVLDEWDGDAVTVESVRVSDEATLASSDDFSASVSLSVDLFGSDETPAVVADTTPSITGEDTLAIEMETSLPAGNVEGYDVDVNPADATLQSDGTVSIEVELVLAGPGERETDDESTGTVETTRQEIESRTAARRESASDRESPTDQESPSDEQSTSDQESTSDRESTSARDSTTDRGESSRDAGSDSRNHDVPPFKDHALLQDVYENHDTFAEMADAIEMDVTGETVRRYMIDCGIHEPNSYRTESKQGSTAGEPSEPDDATKAEQVDAPDAPATDDTVASTTESVHPDAAGGPGQSADTSTPMDGEEKTLVSDGIGIPDSVEIDELIETVNRSRTIHEVSRNLDFDRAEARELLEKLNLLDLVLGRIDSDPNRTISRDDVIDRLRAVSHPEA